MIRLTIAKKLVAGFGLTTLLLTGLALVGYASNRKSAHNVEQVAAMMTDTAAGGDAAVSMLMARMKIKEFLIRNSPQDMAAYEKWRQKFNETLAASRAGFQDPERLRRLDEIEKLFASYHQTFKQVEEIIVERNNLRQNVLDVVGKQTTDQIKQAKYLLFETAQDTALSAETLPALLDLLEGRLYVIKFMGTSEEGDYERAYAELKSSRARLAKVVPKMPGADLRDLLTSAQQGLDRYTETFDRVHNLVLERNALVIGTIDELGPQIADLQIQIQQSLTRDGAEVAARANREIRTANWITLTVSLAAALGAVLAATLIYLGIVPPLKKVIDRVGEIAEGDGDLTQRVDDQRHDELGELGGKVNAFISKTHDTILAVRQATTEVGTASVQIRDTSQTMAGNMEQQTGRVEAISQVIEEMTRAMGDVADRTADASRCSNQAGEMAEDGGHIVIHTIDGMNTISQAVSSSARSVEELGRRGEQIGEIVAVINEIADQTNLLALNAAIEAARAGEHGRGFAVVADEVRKLADRTTQATGEIGESIRAIQDETGDAVQRMATGTTQVDEGVESARKAGHALEQIVGSTREVAGMIHGIAAATEEQSASAEQISRSVEDTRAGISEASGGAQQNCEAVAGLTQKAKELQDLVGRFKLADRPAGTAAAARP